MPRTSWFTLPNLISTSRVALAFGFVVSSEATTRLALIGVASLTDFLDGWLARRTHSMSKLGALIDPVADRFFVVAVVGSYVVSGQLSAWQAVAILFRDVMSIVGWFVARNVSWLRPIHFAARPLGKIVTGAQLITFVAVLFAPRWANPLVLVVASLGIAATVDYTLMLWREREIPAVATAE